MTARHKILLGLSAILLLATAAAGQTAPPQNVPDAPSASRPAQTLPPPGQVSPPAPTVPPANPEPSEPPPPAEIKQVPPGTAAPVPGSSRDQLFTLSKQVNFVVVPVTVKDDSGRLVEGLTKDDFSVLEDDTEQKITFFTSDPFPLSAAVVLDLGIPEATFKKVKNTLSSLVGAFGQFDEVSLYTYGNTVQKVQDFTAVNDRLSASIKRIKDYHAQEGGAPVVDGPFASGPTVNGRPIDPGKPTLPTSTGEVSRVLNDAVLEAALDLGRRGVDRRKVLFIISDGRERGSSASYAEVLKVLLSRQIAVYAIGVDSAAIPGYGKIEQIRLPGFGTGNILPKYASATGGEVFNEFTQSAIEQAYARVTEDARNQYTLGYTTRATPSTSYRNIEVLVHRPGLKVAAKAGYYPLPPARAPAPPE